MTDQIIVIDPLDIDTSAGTQARVSIRQAVVDEYTADLKKGDLLPEPVVYAEKGSKRYVLADGFHTRLAWIAAFRDRGMPVRLREGSIFDAKLYAAGANAQHGVRRRDKDIHNAVRMLLLDAHTEGWADTVVAEYAKCHRTTVKKVRDKMVEKGELEKTTKRKHKRGDETVEAKVPPKKKAAKKEKPQPAAKKSQDDFDREAIVDAIKTLDSVVCTEGEALRRYRLQEYLEAMDRVADWLDGVISHSQEQETEEATDDEAAFLMVH